MISIVLPTYNERENIENLITQILQNVPGSEIIVVDDNSPDKTWELVQDISKGNKNVRVIRRTSDRGLVRSIKAGISEARGDFIGWMDADLGMPPATLPGMLKALGENDVAVGSRYVKGGRDTRGLLRVVSSRLINLFANIFLGFGVKDYDSGFILAKREVMDKIPLKQDKAYGSYCIEFLYDCIKSGFRVKELPYTFKEREFGDSKTADRPWTLFRHGITYSLHILKVRFKNNDV